MLLTHDELFKVGEINIGSPRRMNWNEIIKEFPAHFIVLRDIEYNRNRSIKSAVIVKVSFGDNMVCKDYVMKNPDCKWRATSDCMWKKLQNM